MQALALLLPLLKSRRAMLAAAAIAVVFGAYLKGRSDLEAEYSRKAAEIAQETAKREAEALAAAYERGRQASLRAAQNAEKVREIVDEARAEAGAGDECLSAATVERLRGIR